MEPTGCDKCGHNAHSERCNFYKNISISNLDKFMYRADTYSSKKIIDTQITKNTVMSFETFKGVPVARCDINVNLGLRNRYNKKFIEKLKDNDVNTYDVTSHYDCMCNKTVSDDACNLLKKCTFGWMPDACTWMIQNICKCDDDDFCGKLCTDCNDICCYCCRKYSENVEFV